ncbi:hypothetical protein VF21_08816 [Pseudogymnoascus sp. 05NY08]|nr:hypothetical protein VF21_08816 [Pseudogymnoascus sp. 05NY08]
METPYYTENNNVGVNSSRVVLTRAASAKYESNISLPDSDRAHGHFAGIRCVSGISGDAESQMVPSSEERKRFKCGCIVGAPALFALSGDSRRKYEQVRQTCPRRSSTRQQAESV